MSRRTQRSQIYATSSTRSREFQELEMRKHLHGPKNRLPSMRPRRSVVGVKLINWKRRENTCVGLLDATDTKTLRKENADGHWKTVVNGLIAEPTSPCVPPPRLGTRETDNGNWNNEACNIECCTQDEPSRSRMGFGTDEVSSGNLLQLAHMECECCARQEPTTHLGSASAVQPNVEHTRTRLRCNVHPGLVQCDSQKPLEQERRTGEVHPRVRHSQGREAVE